jgi:hypothetical protein
MSSNPAEATHGQELSLLHSRPGSCNERDFPRDRPISAASATSSATDASSARPPPHPKARKLLRLQGRQSSEIGAVNSPRSAAKRPINSNSSSAPEGQRQRILTSTARERLLASGRRNPMFSSSRSSLRARSTRVGAVPTVLSRSREPVMIWRCSGLAV